MRAVGCTPTPPRRASSTISGVSGFGWVDGWCEGTKHAMHQVGRDRYVALWELKVRVLGVEKNSERRDRVVCGDHVGYSVSLYRLFDRSTSSVIGSVAYRNRARRTSPLVSIVFFENQAGCARAGVGGARSGCSSALRTRVPSLQNGHLNGSVPVRASKSSNQG